MPETTLLVSGSLAFDRIMDFPGKFRDHILPENIHVLSVSFLVKNLVEHRGGTAGNVAYNLALLGTPSTILSQAGNDFGSYMATLEQLGVDTSQIAVYDDERTAAAYITTDSDNNQISAFHPAVMARTKPVTIPTLVPDAAQALAIVCAGNPVEMSSYVSVYREHHVRYLYDPAQQIPSVSPEDLRDGIAGAAVLLSNDYELQMICERTGLTRSTILEQVDMIIMTKGASGSEMILPDRTIDIPVVPPTRVVDPTGAGDAYRSGILVGLIRGLSLEQTGRLAATIASFPIEHVGTQSHAPSREDIRKRYSATFNETIHLP